MTYSTYQHIQEAIFEVDKIPVKVEINDLVTRSGKFITHFLFYNHLN